jgi:hypothetical protein
MPAKPVKGCLSSLNQNRQAVSPPLSTKVTAEIDISKLPLDWIEKGMPTWVPFLKQDKGKNAVIQPFCSASAKDEVISISSRQFAPQLMDNFTGPVGRVPI